MPWRRLTSFSFGSTPPPRAPFFCNVGACCGGLNPWVRTRTTVWTGSVKSCGLNIQSYDPTADPGRFETITGTWQRRILQDGSVVKTCDMEVTITAPSPSIVKVTENCGSSEISGPADCEFPTSCDNPPPCTVEDDTTIYAGGGEITAGDLAAQAEAQSTSGTVPDWSTIPFAQSLPNIIAGVFGRDQRGIASASYRRTRLEIEVRGLVRAFLIEWLDTLVDLTVGGGTTTEARSLLIDAPGLYQIEWTAAPNYSRTAGQGMVSIEY